MLELYINDVEIPQSDIIKINQQTQEAIKFNFSNLIAMSMSIELDNTDPDKYDADYEDSLLYEGWYNKQVVVYDTTTQEIIWNGLLKNVAKNDNEKTLTLTSKNYIREMVDTEVNVAYGTSGTSTPSDVIYYILTALVGIPESCVNSKSFEIADQLQEDNDCFVRILYSDEKTATASSIIKEICRITSSDVFLINNIIYYSQWTPYGGIADELINNIIEGTYKSEYSDAAIYNTYKIYYDGSGTVALATGSDADSIDEYGRKVFSVPDDEIDSTDSDDYKILLTDANGAAWCGANILSRHKNIKKTCKFTVDSIEYGHVQLYDDVELTYDAFTRQPMKLISRKHDAKNRSVDFECEFLSTG